MKKFYILLIALFVILISSCYKSQFSTTTRHNNNGKVSYANSYHKEKINHSKKNLQKNQLKATASQKISSISARKKARSSPEPEITRINSAPLSDNENLIASISKESTIIAVDENRVVLDRNLILSLKKHYGIKMDNSLPDTIKRKAPKKRTTNDTITYQVIKYKNGHEETVKIIYQSHDTLKYELISEQGVVRSVMMEKVDTILQVKSYSGKEKKENVVDARKTEDLGIVGLVFSILGWIPVIGIPFALVAIILLLNSFGKIRRHPEKFKGKEVAIAGLVIWVIGLMGYIILLALGAFTS